MAEKSLEQRIKEAVSEEISIVPHDPRWPAMYENEARRLLDRLPDSIVLRIEHFGSTAVPDICAKPIVDMLVEVSSLELTKEIIVPILESDGYDYFWRPEFDKPPMYAWFIKRDSMGVRTHHIHMVEADSSLWDRLFFRDYLREFPQERENYSALKQMLSEKYPSDREAYTRGKTEFVVSVTQKAKKYYSGTCSKLKE